MAKPRVVIADTDVNYILPLQLKFVEECFESIDLEIVTDVEYFHNMFMSPQNIDILIVSEKLYDDSLCRHNIENIFLMTGQYDYSKVDNIHVNCIFKYTSIKEIFNEVIGMSGSFRQVDTVVSSEPKIILVYSASGGVGKTTVAMGMAVSLTQSHKRVLYINASYLQSFQRFLNNMTSISANDFYSLLLCDRMFTFEEIKPFIRKELFSYLPPFRAALTSLGLNYGVYERIAVIAKSSGEFDYIIIDADAGFTEENVSLLGHADRVIMVTGQDSTAVFSLNNLILNMSDPNREKYIFVCNNFNSEEDNALLSPVFSLKFSINEYIAHFPHYDHLKIEDFASNSGIKKVSYLAL